MALVVGILAWYEHPIQTARGLWRDLLGEKPLVPHRMFPPKGPEPSA